MKCMNAWTQGTHGHKNTGHKDTWTLQSVQCSAAEFSAGRRRFVSTRVDSSLVSVVSNSLRTESGLPSSPQYYPDWRLEPTTAALERPKAGLHAADAGCGGFDDRFCKLLHNKRSTSRLKRVHVLQPRCAGLQHNSAKWPRRPSGCITAQISPRTVDPWMNPCKYIHKKRLFVPCASRWATIDLLDLSLYDRLDRLEDRLED